MLGALDEIKRSIIQLLPALYSTAATKPKLVRSRSASVAATVRSDLNFGPTTTTTNSNKCCRSWCRSSCVSCPPKCPTEALVWFQFRLNYTWTLSWSSFVCGASLGVSQMDANSEQVSCPLSEVHGQTRPPPPSLSLFVTS
jgi:hypothetical protein